MLPTPLMDRLPPGARIIEIGAGNRYDTLEHIHAQRPDLQLAATEHTPERLTDCPAFIETIVDDATNPRWDAYQGAELLISVRCPTDLQPSIARIADKVDAALAIRALKDEWAHLDPILGPHQLHNTPHEAWRVWRNERLDPT